MANEFTVTIGVSLINGNLRASFPQLSRQYTQTTAGISDQVLAIGTSEENVSTTDITTAGFCVLHNLDSTNFVQYGMSDGGTMKATGRLKAGDVHFVRLDNGITLRMKADTASCKVRIMIFET